jgi:hypothetical protein
MKLRHIRRLIKNRYIMISVKDAEDVRHYIEFDMDDRADKRKMMAYDEAEVIAIRAAVCKRDGYEQLIVLTLG